MLVSSYLNFCWLKGFLHRRESNTYVCRSSLNKCLVLCLQTESSMRPSEPKKVEKIQTTSLMITFQINCLYRSKMQMNIHQARLDEI